MTTHKHELEAEAKYYASEDEAEFARDLRERCAQRIYDKTMKEGMLNTDWSELPDDVKEGFRKMVAEVFAVLFEEDRKEIAEYFTGYVLEIKE